MNVVIEFVETIVKQVKFFLSGDFGSAITIPAGRYAVFSITGALDTQQLAALRKLWQELWSMDLSCAFSCDFEEYRSADQLARLFSAAAEKNRAVKRDAFGRAKVAAPAEEDDIARKKEIDDIINGAVELKKLTVLGDIIGMKD